MLVPPSFIDILTQNKYYCIPQVENGSLEYSHAISSEILSAIHKMLTDSNCNLICIARNECGHIKKHVIPYCGIDVPYFMEIQNMSLKTRKNVLLKVLNIDENFAVNCVSLFPESWQLFILTLKYLIDKAVASYPLLYSLLLCRIFLSCVDSHIDICRSTKLLDKKFDTMIKNFTNNGEVHGSLKDSIVEALQDISCKDSLVCAQSLLSYFHLDIKMKINNRLFDRNLVHSMAQFQSCFLHIKYLNNLLNLPYPNFIISDFYNGTFVYNLTSNLMKRVNLDSYIDIKLQNSPTIFNVLTLIIEKLKEYSSELVKCNKKQPKRRKKKKKLKEDCIKENEENSSEGEFIF
ncbi:hypothetical protein NQ314_018008 [Rhamnusium bicolor]|uniref:Uncharacterized protein n=1 Tax=Rhamnusium bicolor TaxID=1586634 RepID=A0AAV8WT20_9CUCU|nr:hypothetical protein NQ314_018008 [Rhamnusium bicolor]